MLLHALMKCCQISYVRKCMPVNVYIMFTFSYSEMKHITCVLKGFAKKFQWDIFELRRTDSFVSLSLTNFIQPFSSLFHMSLLNYSVAFAPSSGYLKALTHTCDVDMCGCLQRHGFTKDVIFPNIRLDSDSVDLFMWIKDTFSQVLI